MTSMWMVQNDDGRYLDWLPPVGAYEFGPDGFGQTFGKADAELIANQKHGHLVEMVPVQEPPILSRSEVKYVQDAHERRFPIEYLHSCNVPDGDQEDVLYAYVTGRYTAEPEPTKYNVKVPHMAGFWYTKNHDGDLAPANALVTEFVEFTMAEIKHYGLEDCERVEVQKNGEADNA